MLEIAPNTLSYGWFYLFVRDVCMYDANRCLLPANYFTVTCYFLMDGEVSCYNYTF